MKFCCKLLLSRGSRYCMLNFASYICFFFSGYMHYLQYFHREMLYSHLWIIKNSQSKHIDPLSRKVFCIFFMSTHSWRRRDFFESLRLVKMLLLCVLELLRSGINYLSLCSRQCFIFASPENCEVWAGSHICWRPQYTEICVHYILQTIHKYLTYAYSECFLSSLIWLLPINELNYILII